MSQETGGHAPWNHSAFDFFYLELSIEIHEVNGKAHEECVDRLAWRNPETFTIGKTVATEQAFAALGSAIGNFKLSGKHGAAGAIGDLEAAISGCGQP